jgi:hypothetical protein
MKFADEPGEGPAQKSEGVMTFNSIRAGFKRGRTAQPIGRLATAIALGAGLCLPVAKQVQAQDASVAIELNRLQDVDGACRISLVFTNGLSETVDALSIETVLFNKDGAVERFLVLKSNPLPKGKVRVQQFDAKGLGCDGVGKILLNDVKECEIKGVAPDDCIGVINPSSRTDAAFYSSTTASADKKTQ